MPAPTLPSAIWSLNVDAPVLQDANYAFSQIDRAYLDSQARGIETHLVQSLLTGTVCTWRTLDPTSGAGAVGDVVCLAGLAAGTVTRATGAALAASGSSFGILVSPGSPGSTVRVAVLGWLPPTITGLPVSGNQLYARVNTTTARVQTVSSVGSSDFVLGSVDAAGNLNLAIQLPPQTGSGSGITQLTGDVAAGPGSGSVGAIVQGLLTKALPALATGFLEYNGTAWVFASAAGVFTPGGDLGGTPTTQEVTGLLTKALPALATGSLEYNGTAWVFATAFAPGGDLGGTATTQEVTGLLTKALPALAGTPSALVYSGSAWAFETIASIFTPGGDVGGTATVQEVVGLLNHALPSLGSGPGLLDWNGTAWVFTSASGLFAPGGDLAGSSTSQEVTGILSHALPSLAPGYLLYTGSAWAFGSAGQTLTFQPGGTASANVFTTWAALMTAAASVTGPLTIFFDGSHNGNAATIPSGTYAFTNPDVTFQGPWPLTTAAFLALTVASGATLSGVARFKDLAVASASSAPVVSLTSGSNSIQLVNASIAGSSTAAFFSVQNGSTTCVFDLFGFSLLGDGTHAAITTGSGATSTVTMFDAATLTAGVFAGAGTNHVTIASSGVTNNSGVTPTYGSIAGNVGYNDGLVAPTIGQTTVQGAIDYLKAHGGGGGGATLVFQPGGTASGSTFTSWSALYAAAGSITGPLTIFFDCTHNANVGTIPSGTYAFTQPYVEFVGAQFAGVTSSFPTITCVTGCTITGVSTYRQIIMASTSTSPITTFSLTPGQLVIRLDDVGVTGSSTAPYFSNAGTASTCIFNLYETNGSEIGDGVHPAFSATSTGSITLISNQSSFIPVNCIAGTNASIILFGPSAIGTVGIPVDAASSGFQTLVFRPGGAVEGNTFTSWASLFSVANGLNGPVKVFFDGSKNAGVCTIPSGAWAFTTQLLSFEGPNDFIATTVSFASGCTISNTGAIRVDGVNLSSASSSAVFTNQAITEVRKSSLVCAGSAPMILWSGSNPDTSIGLYRTSAILAGTQPVLSVTGSTNVTVYLYDAALVGTGTISNTGSGTVQIGIRSNAATVASAPGVPVALLTAAAFDGYNDSLVAPAIGAANVQSAIDYLKSHGGGGGAATLVFQPGGTAAGSTFTSWSALFTASAAITGPLTVFFDGSHNAGACTIPSGTYAFTQPFVTFQGNAPLSAFLSGSNPVHVTCATGATISGLHHVTGMILDTTATAAIITYSSGVSSLTVDRAVLQSSGSAPFISVTGSTTFVLGLDPYSQLGDGTHVAFACTSSVQAAIAINTSTVSAGALSGNIAQTVDSPNVILGAAGFSPTLINVAPTLVVFAPGSTVGQGGYNSFTTWADLYSAVVNVKGPITVFFDSTHSAGACTIPSGTWTFTQPRVTFSGALTGSAGGSPTTTVTCATGATLSGVTDFENLIMVAGGTAPVMTFGASTTLQLRDMFIHGGASAPFLTVTAGTLIINCVEAAIGDPTTGFAAVTRSGSGAINTFMAAGLWYPGAAGGTFSSSNIEVGMDNGIINQTGVGAYYGTANPTVIIFQPGGSATTGAYNCFYDWAQVVQAANSQPGPVQIFFDGSHNSNACTIPAGAWSFTRPFVEFTGASNAEFASTNIAVQLNIASGATLAGVSKVSFVQVNNLSTSPVFTSTGSAFSTIYLENMSAVGSSSAPLFQASGTSTYRINARNVVLGDGTHAVITTSGGTANAVVNCLGTYVDLLANALSGTGAVINVFDAATVNGTAIASTLETFAHNIGYDDTITPHLGSTNVQGAIDALKALTAGGGGGITALTGDVVASGSGSVIATVEAISGTSPIPITPNVLQWIQGATGPTLTQAQAANASAPVNFTIRPQVPGASATNATNGTGGSLVVDLATPVNGGTKAFLEVTQAGSPVLFVGQHTNTTDSAIYGPVVPSVNNFSWLFSTIATVVNAPSSVGNVEIEIAGSGFANFSAFGGNSVVQFFNSGVPDNGGGSGVFGLGNAFVIPTSAPSNSALLYAHSGALETYASAFQFHRLQANPRITQVTPTTDVGTTALAVQAQSAFSGATVNKGGANLVLAGGVAASGGIPGGATIQTGSGADFVSVSNNLIALNSNVGNYTFGSSLGIPSGVGIIAISNAGTVPSSPTTGGSSIYSVGNTLFLYGGASSGGVAMRAGDSSSILSVGTNNITLGTNGNVFVGTVGGSPPSDGGVGVIGIQTATTIPTGFAGTNGVEIYAHNLGGIGNIALELNAAALTFNANQTEPFIGQATATTNTNGANLTITPQSGGSGGGANSGGNLILEPAAGAGGGSNGVGYLQTPDGVTGVVQVNAAGVAMQSGGTLVDPTYALSVVGVAGIVALGVDHSGAAYVQNFVSYKVDGTLNTQEGLERKFFHNATLTTSGVYTMTDVPLPTTYTSVTITVLVQGRVTSSGSGTLTGDNYSALWMSHFQNNGGVVSRVGNWALLFVEAATSLSGAGNTVTNAISGTNVQVEMALFTASGSLGAADCSMWIDAKYN